MIEQHLARAEQRYGRHVRTDPVALRAALLDTGCPPGEVDAVLAAAAGGAPIPAAPIPAAPIPAAPMTGAPVTTAGRVTWDGPAAQIRAPAVPQAEPTVTLPRRRRRGPWVVAGLILAAVIAAAALLVPRGDPPAPPDRYAVDQVALRYAALGPDLVRGAQRCRPDAVEPGEVERVRCEFGEVAMTLSTFDDPSRLRPRRDTAATGPDSLRGARSVDAAAAVAFDEQGSGTSTVYWDVQIPRPVSAQISSESGSLLDLVAFFDARRFAALDRPAVPGEAFRSGELWAFARSQAEAPGTDCRAGVADDGELAAVRCTLPAGVEAVFVQDADADTLADTRAIYASDQGTVAGTHSFRPWSASDRNLVGQLGQFVSSNDGRPYLYWDDGESNCWGLLDADPALPQDELLRRWGGTTVG